MDRLKTIYIIISHKLQVNNLNLGKHSRTHGLDRCKWNPPHIHQQTCQSDADYRLDHLPPCLAV